MPMLPTFEVTDAQAQRLLAAFGSVEAYQAWLKRELVSFVLSKELEDLHAQFQQALESKRAELEASLTA